MWNRSRSAQSSKGSLVGDRRFSDRGAAAVEMAIATILLVLLSCGIADLGRALFTYVSLQDAAQEGAIYGSFEPSDATAIAERVVESVDYPKLDPSNVAVTCPAGSPTGGKEIAITVTHAVDLITPIVGQMLGGSIDLSRTFIGEVFIGECLT